MLTDKDFVHYITMLANLSLQAYACMSFDASMGFEMTDNHHSKGGKARAEKLSAAERKAIAKNAASARWNKDLPAAEFGSVDHPLRIGDLEIPCYVLEDGRRVLVQRGMMSALNMTQGTAGRGPGDRLTRFAATKSISPYISNELRDVITNPIPFRVGGSVANGYEATVIADLCDAVLSARDDGVLHYQQEHIAKRCNILVRGFARVGIIALVDEATGYQEVRARKALEEILDKFLSDELRKWAKTFPDEFYKEMFRLRGWSYAPFTVKRPGVVGKYTNDLVYDRLAPGVLDELRRKNPSDEKGRRKNRHHQWLTEDVGDPRLREHLASVITLMRASNDWPQFKRMIDRALPRFGDTRQLALGD